MGVVMSWMWLWRLRTGVPPVAGFGLLSVVVTLGWFFWTTPDMLGWMMAGGTRGLSVALVVGVLAFVATVPVLARRIASIGIERIEVDGKPGRSNDQRAAHLRGAFIAYGIGGVAFFVVAMCFNYAFNLY